MASSIRHFECDELYCVANEEGEIGRGGLGVVLFAFHATYDVVAIKCFEVAGGYRKAKSFKKKMNNELAILECINHDNVVRVLGWSHWRNTAAIVMEYLPGGNLMELVESIDLDPLLKLRICIEVTNGLSFIHQNKVIHGDMKPENVLLTNDLHCKISDFGSPKISSYTGGITTTKMHGRQREIAELYAAPEYLSNAMLKLKPSYDAYSFSIVVYVVLRRQLPLSSFALWESYKAGLIAGQRPDLEDIMESKQYLEETNQLDEIKALDILIDIMADCWQQNPSHRPTMLEVQGKLHRVLTAIPSSKILQIVTITVEKMEISKPVRSDYECVPLNEIQLFGQQNQPSNAAISSNPASLIGSSSISITPSPLLKTSSEQPNISSIKSSAKADGTTGGSAPEISSLSNSKEQPQISSIKSLAKANGTSSDSESEISSLSISKASADDLYSPLIQPCPLTKALPHSKSRASLKDMWETQRDLIKFEKKIGEGRFGEVWKGTWMRNIEVAIKTFKDGTMTSADYLHEAEIIKALLHEKLLCLYAVVSSEPMFIITEYMSHGNLLNYFKDGPGKNTSAMDHVNILLQIASGMAYMKQMKYIHRDLRAANILVGEKKICKVADFRLAKSLTDDVYTAGKDELYPIKWTPLEAAHHRLFSVKSDVWSFGILCTEVITKGRVPYPGMMKREVIEKLDKGYRIPKSSLVITGSSCLDTLYPIMVRCWMSEAADRPTFQFIHKFLEDYVADSSCNDINEEMKNQWFFGNISHQDAEKLLVNQKNQRGTFVIRQSETGQAHYLLSVLDEEDKNSMEVKHYRIQKSEERFYISFRRQFESVQKLVEYYKTSADGLCCPLLLPCPLTKAFTDSKSQASQKDVWETRSDLIKFEKKIDGWRFGEVWKGTWNTANEVAIKTFKHGTMASADYLHEAEIMKALQHEKLLYLYAVVSSEPMFIITEYMSHGNLINYLKDGPGKNTGSIDHVNMLLQITSGMAYMEQMKYIHRDLRAGNILVGENKTCKVADFRLAKSLTDDVYTAGKDMNNQEVVEQLDKGYIMPKSSLVITGSSCLDTLYPIMVRCWMSEAADRPTFQFIHEFLEDCFQVTD